jgi:hypothetical protein
MVQDQTKYYNLSRICNSTFGTQGPGENKTFVAQNIKFHVVDDKTLKASYQTIVTFASKSMLRDIREKYKKDALVLLEKAVKNFVAEYKEQFGEEIKLSLKDFTITDDVEFVSYSMYSPINRGFYRFNCLVEVK